MLHDLILIGYAWITTMILQWLAAPFLLVWFQKKTLTGGWAWGRLAAWLAVSLVIWFAAHLGLPANTGSGIWLVILGLAWLSHKQWLKYRVTITEFVRSHRQVIFWQELLFLIGFFGLSLVRTYSPQILDLEKFMDAGLMVAYGRSPTLPLQDMWLSGETVNYYTFGHFIGNVMSQFWHIDIVVSYNLLLGLLCGLILMESFALVVDWVGKPLNIAVKAGLVAMAAVGLGSNGQPAWYWLSHNFSFNGFWYPDATRFIDRTIHEFPSYSFIVSDLHGHLWSLPIVLGMIWLCQLWVQAALATRSSGGWKNWLTQPVSLLAVGIGICLGAFIMTNTWDFAIYGLVLGLAAVGVLITDVRRFWVIVFSAIVIGGIALITAAPWIWHFTSISQGVFAAYEHSPFWQLLVLWLPHSILAVLAVGLALRQWWEKSRTVSGKLTAYPAILVVAVVVTAAVLLILPEVIFVKDIYPNHPRANTMFKLTFQAFVLMGLVIGWLTGQLFQQWELVKNAGKKRAARWQTIVGLSLVGLFLLAVLSYPYFGYRDYYGAFKQRVGLEGLQWLAAESMDDYNAVIWLKQATVGRPVILEAVGESYTTFARVSTFTGLPTILGWRVHEWLWRGGFDIPGQRTEEVRIMYEQPTSPEATALFGKYRVQYIFVGSKERETYPALDLAGLQSLGQTVYISGETTVIALPSLPTAN
jgi:uncharacterized membrane protein